MMIRTNELIEEVRYTHDEELKKALINEKRIMEGQAASASSATSYDYFLLVFFFCWYLIIYVNLG
jgi:hypothetical protein